MDKTLFFDTTCSGHRSSYDLSLMKGVSQVREVLFVSKITNQMSVSLEEEGIQYVSITTSKKHHLLHDLSLLIQMVRIARRSKIKHIHLLYLDSLLILLLILAPFLWIFNFKITGTLHWSPNKFIKRLLLKILILGKTLQNIVVHGDYTKDRIRELLGNRREDCVFSIPYPHLHNTGQTNPENGLPPDERARIEQLERPFLLLFGGLRYDKGADLLIESLKHIQNRRFTLLIVGKEEYFDHQFIERELEGTELKNHVFLKLGYVPDEEVSYYFAMTDAVVLPYRRIFTGQSGPLTEGAANRKFIIGPDHGELGYTIKTYDLGFTYAVEDTNDLANMIQTYIDIFNSDPNQLKPSGFDFYKGIVSEQHFWHRYQEFFTKVAS
ncbi:glycosyltransferase family 4 protein [Paenibacillus ihbetae]|uniref:Glycosyl transferase family 1 domain-containing protein n=1 Tax=Paenibacillus ihbetae TaxID=1870820 RepID=A0ABX3JR38_9BACL|nr:glycosyltransferase family 4 protein [Paenibacillus ihbetae]OOC59306.1 hypothetical protein BBD40_27170 [Paenibacillus ihbetae]